MFDTTVFNHILNGKIEMLLVEEGQGEFYATPIQETELRDTPNEERREALLRCFKTVSDETVPSISTYDMPGAGYDQGAYSGGKLTELYNAIQDVHKEGEMSGAKDSNIAAVAIFNDLTLVTDDRDLQVAMETTHPGSCYTEEEFIEWLSS